MHAIVLAHEPSFAIGPVEVHPATRTVRRDGVDEIVEPRVMQVLVALAAANGGVLARDDLVQSCWDGRIVGDDAINRVLSRLRRLAEGIGHDAFAIETITRTGYRLRHLDPADVTAAAASPGGAVDRRTMLVAAGVAGVAALGGWQMKRAIARRHEPAPAVAALMEQAELALRQGTREGQTQAIGLYQKVVADDPDYADGWASLGIAYAFIAHYRSSATARLLQQRAREAARRARSIDADNVLARVALATARPTMGNWRRIEAALLDALAQQGRNQQLLFALGSVQSSVGRFRDALVHADLLAKIAPPTPSFMFTRSYMLWSGGRLEEADAVLAEAGRLYPTHFAVWFGRFYVLMYTGRADAAIALAADRDSLPSGIAEEEIGAVVRVARAMLSRSPTDINAVIAEQDQRARQAAGAAENAAQFAAALGRRDDSFRILNAYYFGDGFDVGEIRFTRAQGTLSPRNDRLTNFLFNPVLADLRHDPRFERLVARLGLVDYWRGVGKAPDYLAR
jgi:DNA-binding winged helix-turn-helix (wHTH) protein/tetratricopeptide (TPR) repeat protein